MKEETKDRRVKYTKNQLRSSLITLLKHKPLYKISIKEICEAADINRSTFYAHYESPYDLYEEIIWATSEEIKRIIDKFPKQRSMKDHVEIFRQILEYTQDNRDLCLVLLSDKSNLTVGESLGTIFDMLNNDMVYPNKLKKSPDLESYAELFIVSGTASIIWRWLNEENRISCDELARLICGLLLKGIGYSSKVKALLRFI